MVIHVNSVHGGVQALSICIPIRAAGSSSSCLVILQPSILGCLALLCVLGIPAPAGPFRAASSSKVCRFPDAGPPVGQMSCRRPGATHCCHSSFVHGPVIT